MSHFDKWRDTLEDVIKDVLNGTVHSSVVVETINRDKGLSDFQKECLIDYLLRKL